jgi:predicted cobalt transporter CbtA
MTRTTISVVAGIALVPFAVGLMQASLPSVADAVAPGVYGAPRGHVVAPVEQRFATRYCFSQYKTQQDAITCFARYVR